MRLAAVQTALFLLAFALAGVAALTLVRQAELRAAHAEIEELEDDASALMEAGRTDELIRKIDAPQREPSRVYRLWNAGGRRLGGALEAPPSPRPEPRKYWTVFTARALPPPHGSGARVLVLVHPEPAGMRLAVGEDLSLRERQDAPFLALAFGAAALVSGLGMVGGVAVAGRTLRQADRLAQVVEAFAGGERRARIPVGRRATSELDGLAAALNDMMDREARLVEGLRQTSSAIAHDLRRPLAHHKQLIQDALRGSTTAEAYRHILAQALERIDEVLATFQSLLHIAELEAGAPGLSLVRVDLNALAERVAEAYRPLVEDGGRTLAFVSAAAPAPIHGEPRALGRMLANLVENALAHTPPGTAIELRIEAEGPRLIVRDDGPGVAAGALSRIFERFVRLDASRTTPGNGLGLSLVAATASAFGGVAWAENAHPGLRVLVDFGAEPDSRPTPRGAQNRPASAGTGAGDGSGC